MKLEISYNYEIPRLADNLPVIILTKYELASAPVEEINHTINTFCESYHVSCDFSETLKEHLLQHLDGVKNSKILIGFTQNGADRYSLEFLHILPSNHFRIVAAVKDGKTEVYNQLKRKRQEERRDTCGYSEHSY